jgi:putative membrane protein
MQGDNSEMRRRSPRAFRLDDPAVAAFRPGGESNAVREGARIVVEEEDAPFDEPEAAAGSRPRRRTAWGTWLVSALGGLAVLGLGLGLDRLIRDLFAAYPALGWIAAALALLAALAFLAIILRETAGILRERRIETLRARSEKAILAKDDRAALEVVSALSALYAARPETARARTVLAGMSEEIVDASDRLAVAERELLVPLDRQARRIVANAAKQVSLVTAVSPRAIVDVGFVLYACMRLVRRIAFIYGGRPGFFGFLRLSGNVLSHLAVTGGMAVGDGLIQQVMGLGLAARVSARLGEGVLNGLLTARVGLAAIAVCRPMPFVAADEPRLQDVAAGLFDRPGEPGDTR